MSAKQPSKREPWFRLRCTATFCLAAGVWLGVWMVGKGLETGMPRGARAKLAVQIAEMPAERMSESRPHRHAGPAIVIDPGHGGRDPGKPAGEQLEKTWTLQVSLALAEELRSRGWPVVLTRTDDTTLTLTERSDLANREPRRALVSLHFNSGGSDANGMEVYFAWPKLPETMARLDSALGAPVNTSVLDERGRLLAESLLAAACRATGSRNRGVKNDTELAVLNRTVCPAVLVECGFLTNAAEARNIRSDEWRRKLVAGLADGLESWLEAARAPGYGIAFEPDESVPVSSQAP
jgi:N-acetylmuramoyl-L-alanine amidase